MTVELYDTTLRDGAQMEGISLSVAGQAEHRAQARRARRPLHRGRLPGSNPKDVEFFVRMRDVKLNAKLVAFGATRRAGGDTASDPTLNVLATAGTEYVTIVGKAQRPAGARGAGHHARREPRDDRRLGALLKQWARSVFFDAEHFFDGFFADPDYALPACAPRRTPASTASCSATRTAARDDERCSRRSSRAGALPRRAARHPLHNDAELAVANTLAAVQAASCRCRLHQRLRRALRQRQPVSASSPTSSSSWASDVVTDAAARALTDVSRFVGEVANLSPWPQQPYVGTSAFAHKAGYHADGRPRRAPTSTSTRRRSATSGASWSRSSAAAAAC